MKLARHLAGACLLAATLPVAPAAAITFVPVPVERVVATFKGICLDHLGDPQAQIATGLAAPYGMQPYTGPAKVPPGVYLIDSVQVIIGAEDKSCTITSKVDDEVTVETIATAASAIAPRATAEPAEEGKTLMWLRNTRFGPRYGLGFTVKNDGNGNVATIGVLDLGAAK